MSGRKILVLPALLALAGNPALAQQVMTLEDAIREIHRLQARLDQLESRDAPAAVAAAATPASEAPPMLHLEPYGFLRLDAVRDDSRPNDPQVIGWVQAESGGNRNESSLTIYPRLTRLGVDVLGPKLGGPEGPTASGRLEIDFYALPSSDSRNMIRMRHAYLKLAWDKLQLLAGQTSDLISPLYPAVNADLVMWGAGNLGDRRPQLRVDYPLTLAEDRQILLQGMLGLTGADSGDDFDGNGLLDGEASGRPTYQARTAYRSSVAWARGNLEVGVWGHRSWQEIDAPIAGEASFDSRALGIDWYVPIFADRVWVKGELWNGENLADVRGGIFQGVNRNTGEEVDSRGGWVELGWKPFAKHELAAGFAWDDPDNSDLTSGDATINRTANRIFYLSSVERRFAPFTFGLEYLRWTTHFAGAPSGTDNRLKGFASLAF